LPANANVWRNDLTVSKLAQVSGCEREPDEVLRKVYYKNALKIVPGIDKSLFPAG